MNHKPWRSVSPSQIKSFIRCALRWWFSSIMRITTGTTRAQGEGLSIHDEVEQYLKTGRPADTSQAAAVIDTLGLPASADTLEGIVVEAWVRGDIFDGVGFRGRVDAADARNPLHLIVHDVKTISAKRYALTEQQLASDPQMISYGKFLIPTLAPEAESIELRHTNGVRKKRSEAFARTVTLSRAQLEDKWGAIEGVVDEMSEYADAPEAVDLPHNLDACWDYGRCPHQRWCPAFRNRKRTSKKEN